MKKLIIFFLILFSVELLATPTGLAVLSNQFNSACKPDDAPEGEIYKEGNYYYYYRSPQYGYTNCSADGSIPRYTLTTYYFAGCPSPQIFNETTFNCDTPCTPTPQPDENELQIFIGANAASECNQALEDLGSNSNNNLSCWTDSCSPDENPDYILFGDLENVCPTGFNWDYNSNSCISNTSNDNNSTSPDDTNTSNPDDGTNPDDGNNGSIDCNQLAESQPLPQNHYLRWGIPDSANAGDKYETDAGYFEIISINRDCKFGIIHEFNCPHAQFYNKETQQCQSTDGTLPGDAQCPSGYGKRKLYNFNSGDVGIVPFFLQDLGAEWGKCYQGYNCIDDFNIVKIQQVSCSEDFSNTTLEIKPSEDGNSTDYSTSNNPDFNDKTNDGDGGSSNGVSDSNTSINISTPGGGNYDGQSYTPGDEQTQNQQGVDDSLSESYGILDSIKSDFDNLLSRASNPFQIPNISTGTNPQFCTTVYNKQICLNLCDTFSQFSGIFYYFFSIVFILISIKIYYKSFQMGT